VTFLFTDVEGSTASWEKRPDAMRTALAMHDDIVRSAIATYSGTVFSTGGDGFAAAFSRASAAVQAAVAAQSALASASWPDDLALRVRVGLHTGEGHERDRDYFGPAVNRAARVMDAANGAQILVSAATREVLGGDQVASTSLVDLGVHELRDVVEPMRLYRLDAAGFVSDERPPLTGGVRAGNLPNPAGPILGRGDEVGAVIVDLTLARVVTLTGVGGIGKTRLALEVGHLVQAQWRDGVWFGALETVSRPDDLIPSLLGSLGVDPGPRDDAESLIEGLRYREVLLILDNCEHLLDGVAEVVREIVLRCPAVRVLCTSREPLDVDGERTRRVRSLAVEDAGPAVELFRLRAAEVGASIDAHGDADAILRICRRLDGIPLAIELAAARARSLRVNEIAERLDDMFRLLTGGRRGATERHRTLRATLEWSYDLLSEPERTVLARLSVFGGAFSLEAAEAVAGEGGDSAETVDVIDRLVSRSLVVPVDDSLESRFRLLEPVRQLAVERLARRGEADATRELHAQWYLERIVDLDARWRSGDDQGAWPVAAREFANLKSAFDHLVDSRLVNDAERFVVASYGPIACHFDVSPMYDWAPRAREIGSDRVGPFTASACAIAAWGAILRSDLEGAADWIRRGAAAIEAGSQDDGFVSAAAIHHVVSGGEVAVSDEFLNRSVASALASDDLHRQVWVLIYAGRFDEALERAQRLGNKLLIASARSYMATLAPEGRDEARELFWEAAQECHSYLMRNHAALELGVDHIRRGAAFDGLLLLRTPMRDWLLRGDARVWSVLHATAMGFAVVGEVEFAARVAGAVGDRPLPFVTQNRRAMLDALLDAALDDTRRARHEAGGRVLDAGAAVTESLERIETLAAERAREDVGVGVDAAGLTARQYEVAELVARGLTNKQIAQRLGISRFTAETHVRNILERLDATSRSEIATWVARQSATGSGTRVAT
jgi:predicted ATPase/DNA-binding CsgD family transcriptional regulator